MNGPSKRSDASAHSIGPAPGPDAVTEPRQSFSEADTAGPLHPCPDAIVCQTCPSSHTDDVCLPHEREAAEAGAAPCAKCGQAIYPGEQCFMREGDDGAELCCDMCAWLLGIKP